MSQPPLPPTPPVPPPGQLFQPGQPAVTPAQPEQSQPKRRSIVPPPPEPGQQYGQAAFIAQQYQQYQQAPGFQQAPANPQQFQPGPAIAQQFQPGPAIAQQFQTGSAAQQPPTATFPAFMPTRPLGEPGECALAMRGLVKIFGNLVAVANLNLDIPKGSFYGFVGPNGAGKSTTLNMATGLLTPDSGTAFVNGIDVWADNLAARAQLGVMPDGMRLLDRLSGPDFLVHVGMLRGLPRETARERARQLLATLDLVDAGKKLISDYSAGMTKKISLAAALIHAPSVLVLDEPFEAVDPVSAANIRQILIDFTHRGGTVILSSHVMATVQQLCTHVAVINHGQVLASGTTAEVAGDMSLDERFAQLVGGLHTSEGLSWLAN